MEMFGTEALITTKVLKYMTLGYRVDFLSLLEIDSHRLETYREIPFCCSKKYIFEKALFLPYHHQL